MLNLFKYIYDKVQGKDNIKELAKESGTNPENLPVVLQNHKTATLVRKALKRDENMPALVFAWNDEGFNDVPGSPGLRNGITGQTKAAIVMNLTDNGAINYGNFVFTFADGGAIGVWKDQIDLNIPWARNQAGVQNVITSVTRINRLIDNDIGSAELDIENFSDVFNHPNP